MYGLLENYVLPWIQGTCGPNDPHVKLERELEKLLDYWPPLSDPVLLDVPVACNAGKRQTCFEPT